MKQSWWLCPRCQDLEEGAIRACVFSFLSFLTWGSGRAHQFDSLRQDQSTVTQRVEMTVADCSPTILPKVQVAGYT